MKLKNSRFFPISLGMVFALIIVTLSILPLHPIKGLDSSVEMAASSPQVKGLSILFSSNRSGTSDIFAVRPDGSGEVQLTHSTDNDVVTDWSPHSGNILVSSDRDGDFEIYEMAPDGTNTTRLTDNDTDDFSARWSPDSTRIVFSSNRDGDDLDIFVMNADGANQINLTNNDILDQTPTWSPDGSKIAYMSWPKTANESIYVMNADGSNKTRVSQGYELDFTPDWSPDGTKIGFMSIWETNYSSQVYVMDSDGSNRKRLTSSSWNGSPAWSPDGKQIAYMSLSNNSNSDIYLMNADGSGKIRLTDKGASGAGPSGPVWAEASFVPCDIPFFWQRDPDWNKHPLRTEGQCSAYCSTIGNCGCTLTSATMVFNHYGKEITPPELSDCMGKKACPFYWNVGKGCADGYVSGYRSFGFSYRQLENELDNGFPVLVGMHERSNPINTHWVVVLEGEDSNPAKYVIHDPWFEGGAYRHLDSRTENGYVLDSIRVYEGSSNCLLSAVENSDQREINPPPALFVDKSLLSEGAGKRHSEIIAAPSEVISGTAQVYWMTAMTMTLKLSATSSLGNIEDMVIWTNEMPNGVWQPFKEFVYVPVAAEVYARFRDNMGNVSAELFDSSKPIYSPPPDPYFHITHVPMVIKTP